MAVARVEDALSHQDLHNVEERRMTVQVEADLVEDEGLLRHELVLLRVEAHFVVASLQSVHAILVSKLLVSLLSLGGLVPGKLSQKLARAGHVGVLLEVLGGDEEAAESLEHDMALVHVLLVGQQHGGEEAVEEDDGVVSRLLDVQLERLRHLREPVDDEVTHLLVRARDLDKNVGPAGLSLAL